MEKLTFDGLQPEIFTSQPWLEDFFEVLADTLNDRIRYPADQLAHIRNVLTMDDPVVLYNTLCQLGFELPLDFIKHNLATLQGSLTQLALYSERSGTRDFARSMSFIYGRTIDVESLYTQDYTDFYREPYGPLQVDGGNWYKTTHVDLTMQMLPSDYTLLLPRGVALRDRFLDAFYEFAPWNVVVNNFNYGVDIQIPLHISAFIWKQPKRYIEVGVGSLEVIDLQLIGPDTVFENGSHQYRAIATMANAAGTVVKRMPVNGVWTSSRTGLVTFEDDAVAFSGVSRDTSVTLYVEYKGRSASKDVLVRNDESNIQYITIDGPDSILASESANYAVVAHTKLSQEPTSVRVTGISDLCSISANEVRVYSLEENGEVYLNAELVLPNGTILKAVKLVSLIYVDPEVHLVSLEIDGPDEYYEGETKEYALLATYSDGRTQQVLGDWSTNSSSVTVTPSGELYALYTESDITVTLKAVHQYRGKVMTALKDTKMVRRVVSITHTEIIGPSTIIEGTRNQYVVLATFSNGQSGYLTAEWQSTRFYIDDRGILEPGSVGVNPVQLQLTATVEGRKAIKQVVAVNTPVTLDNIFILGPDNLLEESVGKYTAYAHYSNGEDVEIRPTWKITGDPTWASVDDDGMLAFSNPLEGIIELVATYTLAGRVYEQGKPIVLVPTTRIIRGLLVSGPTEVEDGKRIVLSATAVYSDGTIEPVSPVWSVQSSDPLNDPVPMADIVSPGILQGRSVDTPTSVTVIARYFKEIAEFEVAIIPVIDRSPNKPESSRIIGPDAFSYDVDSVSFAHAILFEHCPAEQMVSSDWSLDVGNDVAVIDNNGYMWSVDGKDATVTVTSTYTCLDQTVIDSIVVNIVGPSENALTLQIVGSDAVSSLAPTQYVAKLESAESSTEVRADSWSIVSPDGRVEVDENGVVTVLDGIEQFNFMLRAEYTDADNNFYSTLKEISVIRDGRPIFGIGPIGVRTDPDIGTLLDEELPQLVSGQEFTLTAGPNDYMYFCYPAALGLATFVETTSNFEGGWDGATWPDNGDVGDQYGPLAVQRVDGLGNESTWNLYRTDFAGNGTRTYRVTFT